MEILAAICWPQGSMQSKNILGKIAWKLRLRMNTEDTATPLSNEAIKCELKGDIKGNEYYRETK